MTFGDWLWQGPLGGSIRFGQYPEETVTLREPVVGPVVIYGFNAMHVAINIRTRRWGWICFHPPFRCFGKWWPWYFYISRDATPHQATFKIGPGLSA